MRHSRLATAWPLWLTLAALYAPALYLGHNPGDSGKYNVAWLADFSNELFSETLILVDFLAFAADWAERISGSMRPCHST